MLVNNLARKHINKALLRSCTAGSNFACKYYPCSFAGQDCTFCFCPFYPCLLEHGKYVTSGTGRKIWDCSGCKIIHEPAVASVIFRELKALKKPIEEITHAETTWAMRVIKDIDEQLMPSASFLKTQESWKAFSETLLKAPIQNRFDKL